MLASASKKSASLNLSLVNVLAVKDLPLRSTSHPLDGLDGPA
jgi:hypothetical protein